MKWRVWIKGLVAATVAGAASALSAGISANVLAPETFNMNGGLMMMLKLAAMSAALNGLLGAAMYLKQSPVPADDGPAALPPASDA